VSAAAGHALVLSVKPYAEGGALVSLFCRERGLVRGWLKRGAGKLRLLPLDEVAYRHYRRLDGQLGTLTLELVLSRAVWSLGGRRAAALSGYLVEILGSLLPEEHPYPAIWESVQQLLAQSLAQHALAPWPSVAEFERALLAAIGYGLPLADDAVPCTAGAPLAYVSPVSGRAVSRVMGAPYVGRLLPLPALWGGPPASAAADCAAALGLTGFFLQRVAHHKKLAARRVLMDYLTGEAKTHENLAATLADGRDADDGCGRRYG
jgi:DNA repair protein RecO (recombination protein O)